MTTNGVRPARTPRNDDRGPFTSDERKELVRLILDACYEIAVMHDLAFGGRVTESRRLDARMQAESREKAENEAVGPPTPEAWGEVPGDIAGRILTNGQYRWAYRQMVRRVVTIRRLATEVTTFSERVLPEANTSGSRLPDMLTDKKGQGRVEYRELQEAQARRRKRGEV